jgi:hypothetical protein
MNTTAQVIAVFGLAAGLATVGLIASLPSDTPVRTAAAEIIPLPPPRPGISRRDGVFAPGGAPTESDILWPIPVPTIKYLPENPPREYYSPFENTLPITVPYDNLLQRSKKQRNIAPQQKENTTRIPRKVDICNGKGKWYSNNGKSWRCKR